MAERQFRPGELVRHMDGTLRRVIAAEPDGRLTVTGAAIAMPFERVSAADVRVAGRPAYPARSTCEWVRPPAQDMAV